MDGQSRPVAREYFPAERLDLAERYGLEAARRLQAERESADAGEEIEDSHGTPRHSPPPTRRHGPGPQVDGRQSTNFGTVRETLNVANGSKAMTRL